MALLGTQQRVSVAAPQLAAGPITLAASCICARHRTLRSSIARYGCIRSHAFIHTVYYITRF